MSPDRVADAVREHYLSIPGKTEGGWIEVTNDPKKFNMVWRHMLCYRCGQQIEINNFPPPIHLMRMVP